MSAGCPCCGATGGSPRFEKPVLAERYRAMYVECERCGSLFVDQPHWLDEAYAESDPSVNDTGRIGRARDIANVVLALKQGNRLPPSGKWLDYGAGESMLGDLLTVQGYSVDRYDRYVPRLSAEPTGTYVACSLIEVMEHTTDPIRIMRQIGALTQFVLVSTEIYRGQGPAWHYLATEWGQHVTFPSPEGLRRVARAGGFAVEDARTPGCPLEVYLLRKQVDAA